MHGETLLYPEHQRKSDWRRISRLERDFKENVECFEVHTYVQTTWDKIFLDLLEILGFIVYCNLTFIPLINFITAIVFKPTVNT